MKEIWKNVPGYEGVYEVSNMGRLKSIDRYINHGDTVQLRRGRMKAQWPNPDGYLQVKLSRDGKSANIGVHRVVAMTFIDNPYNLPEVNHKDGNRQNNCVSNLEWVTHDENIQDSIIRGTHVSLRDSSGAKNPNFGNRSLSEFYRDNPEAAKKKQGRPGAQNGRCRPVRAVLPDGDVVDFPYIRACGQWLLDYHYLDVKLDHAAIQIARCINTGDTYKHVRFEPIQQ